MTGKEVHLLLIEDEENKRKRVMKITSYTKSIMSTSHVSYYKRIYSHLIPEEVEFLEFDESTGDIIRG